MKKEEQITWIMEKYYNDDMLPCLAASNMNLQEEFIARFGRVSEAVWKSRIKEAADRMGLTSNRHYYDYCAAWCRWENVYS